MLSGLLRRWVTRSFYSSRATVSFRNSPLQHVVSYDEKDTTAMTLNAALGYMGLHEDFQEEMYQEIMAVMPTEEDFVSISLRQN